MAAPNEDRAARWARTWRLLHPTLSWALGATLFVYTTVTGAAHQSPEWYAIIGGLIGGPFVSKWKEARKKDNGSTED